MQLDVILDTRARPDELAELGRLAERFGLGGVWVSSLLDSRDPFTNLVMLAQSTKRIPLGPIAVNPYDTHPVRIASGLHTLNEIAGGRARIVIGGGGEALQALGIEATRRVRAVRECVDIIRAAGSGERVSVEGEMFHVRDLQFRWLEATPPAIYVGASQAQMLRMAAGCADGIMMSDMPAAPTAEALRIVDGALVAKERDRTAFWTAGFTAWHVYDDLEVARTEARRWLFLRGIFRPWLLAQFLEATDVELVMASQAAFGRAFAAGSHRVEGVPDSVLDALADHVTLCATPATLEPVIARLRTLKEAGLSSVALRLYADPAASIRLLGRRVVPALSEQL